jgi:hypothetical protein
MTHFCGLPEPPTELELIYRDETKAPGWYWRVLDAERWRGPFATEDAALADARGENDHFFCSFPKQVEIEP